MPKIQRVFLVVWLALYSFSSCEDVETPQGNVSLAVLQQLVSAHGVALNQKEQESLFLSLPLVASHDSEVVAVGNISSLNAPSDQVESSIGNVAKRQLDATCRHRLQYEGDDACRGYENMPGYVPCRKPCEFTREVRRR
jgi:hypothetical protein